MTVAIIVPREKRRRDPKAKILCNEVYQNIKELEMVESISRKFAKHSVQKNEFLREFALDNYGSVHILEMPVCEKCERPALWHIGGTGYCHACGTTTKNPIQMGEYVIKELLKGKSEEQIEMIRTLANLDLEEIPADNKPEGVI